jgi:hypothetical protein
MLFMALLKHLSVFAFHAEDIDEHWWLQRFICIMQYRADFIKSAEKFNIQNSLKQLVFQTLQKLYLNTELRPYNQGS